MEIRNTFTEVSIDPGLAATVWGVIDFIEHSAEPIDMVAFCIEEKDDKLRMGFKKYTPGMENEDTSMMAAMSVNPTGESEGIDPELQKAMQFMYLYQSAWMRIQKYEMGDH